MNPHQLPSYAQLSLHAQKIYQQVQTFMQEIYFPQENLYFEAVKKDPWISPRIMEEWKTKAQKEGLWNLFLPDHHLGGGLTHFEYAHMAELMGPKLVFREEVLILPV